VRGARFRSRFETGSSVLIDTAPLIYHLEDIQPWSDLTTIAFDLIAADEVKGFVSAISVAELLVKPLVAGAETAAPVEAFLLSMPNTTIAGIDYEVARKAAQVRARSTLRTPDTLLVATAIVLGIDLLLTNDGRLEAAAESEGVKIILLSRFIS